ncbi:MAG TPA: polymorphic toxin-type HINT domain-containing protein [Actinokineospora sp.]|nr:polymorphic toxin-type HINT domain-containing protein [Actinokineospora sp.]
MSWPTAGAEIEISQQGRAAAVAGTPVSVRRADNAGSHAASGRVKVDLLDRAASDRAHISGALMRLAPMSGDVSGPITVDLDYAGIESSYGGGFGDRLTLVAYPDCLLTTPEVPACRQSTPVTTTRSGGKKLSGDVVFSDAIAKTDGSRPEKVAGQSAPMLLAAVGETGGGGGDMKATSLSAAGSWTAGGSGAGFSYNYPITLPAPPVGAAPALSLSYTSGAVDGATSATNNQPSWVGDGWSLSVGGYIERQYKSCSQDLGGNNGQTKTGDQCWATDNASIALGSTSGPLVRDQATGAWHPKHDDGSRVERLTNATNGALNGEYWKVTTTDGTQYFFGMNRLPGWTAGAPETQSVFTAPVFGNNSGEPCYQPTFAASWCQQAYRWNLDYVVDPYGNQVALHYQPETNYYGLNRNTTTAGTQYVRGGYLTHVDYGMNTKAGGAYTQAPATVAFDVAERCVPSGSVTCDPAQLNSGTAASWPDVPADLICASGTPCLATSPSFFTRKKLTTVTTRVPNGSGGWADRDRWNLAHTFPTTADGSAPALWLDNVVHTGLVDGAAAMPPTKFGGDAKRNRTFQSTEYTSLSRYRITSVLGELGGYFTVTYADQDCVGGAPDPATNTTRCFPQYWTPNGHTTPILDWFNKYVVTDVAVSGGTALAKQTHTHYDYLGGAAWHFDENTLADPAYRTWSQWRGYGEVSTTTGNPDDPSGPRTVVKDRFLRGMNGDRAASGIRSVSVTNWLNELPIVDEKQHQGFKFESLSYLDGQVNSATFGTPWSSAATATDQFGEQAFVTGIAVSRTRDRLIEADSWREKRTTTTFTDKGMPASVQSEGEVGQAAQTSCTRTTYLANTAAWMLSYPSAVQRVSGPCTDQNPASSANIISDVHSRYDGQAYGAAPTAGRVTQIDTLDTWPYGGAETFQNGTTKTTYDTVYGRALAVTDALNRTTTTAYTPATGTVAQVTTTSPAVMIANVLTQLVSNEYYHPVSGQTTAKVDVAGARTDYTFDPLGRLTAVWLPGHSKAGGAQANATFGYSISTTSPNVVTSNRLLASGQYSTVHSIVDGQGRTVQTQEPTSYSQGGRVVSDTEYDSQGRAWKTRGPYWDTTAPGGSLLVVDDNAVPTTTITEFDSTNRPIVSKYLHDGVEQWRTTTAYDGDRVTTVPPDGGTAATVISNGLGQKIKTLQYRDRTHTGPNDLADATTYTYTRAGQLETVTDATGKNTWSFAYNLRGAKVWQSDPDAGVSTSTYDAAGQLSTSTDAENRTLAYAYDPLGRRTAMHQTSLAGAKLAGWIYDTLQKGKPTSSVRFTGGKAYVKAVSDYDTAGRPIGSKVVIPNGETGLSGTYLFSTAYDPNTGAVAREVSPAAGGLPEDTMFRTYDALGKPFKSYSTGAGGGAGTVFVSKTEYNQFGQALRVNYADENDPKQVSTTWTYEAGTNRLSSMGVVRATETGNWVANRAYTYTQSGSLTKVADTPPDAAADTQCFGYDYAQRLTKAWTPASGNCATSPSLAGLGGAAPYWSEWTHDVTGNRVSETRYAATGNTVSTSTYPKPGSAHPHAVATVSTKVGTGTPTEEAFTYDNAGGTKTRTKSGSGYAFNYDAEGRVASITDPAGKTSTYLYDADGNRLISRDPTGTTLTIGDTELFVGTGTSTATGTRFYTHGGRQVAVRNGGGLTWKVIDQHGTATTSISASTLAVTKRFQDPYGNIRGAAPSLWPDRHSFIGGFLDTTGYVHLGAREYDPALGRFLTVDPILDLADPQSWTGYAYANNNPVDHSDPSGLWCDGCSSTDIGVNCPPCGGGAPASAPSADAGSGGHLCQGCNGGKGWATPHGGMPSKVGSHGKLVIDLSKVSNTAIISNRYFMYNSGEYYPVEGFEWMLESIPGHVDPDYPWWVQVLAPIAIAGVIAGGMACVGSGGFCLAIIGGVAEASAPPVAFAAPVVGAGVVGVKTISVIDDAINAGAKSEAGAADAAAIAKNLCTRSFSGDTPVLMGDGTTKAFKDIQPGDYVMAADPETGERGPREVTATWPHTDTLHVLVLVDGSTITTTEDHPFWNVTDHQWQRADALDLGDHLATTTGHTAVVRGLSPGSPRVDAAYNLTVDDLHTYFVLAGSTPVLVHNTGLCDPEELAKIWHIGGSESLDASFAYHWGKHAQPLNITPEQYLKDANDWVARIAQPGGKVGYNAKRAELGNGDMGVKYADPKGGMGGIVGPDGKVVTFWYSDAH